ncbi:hypothetical protein EV356DRAFT_508803 [Viridothelium virens]|uniref:DUF7708 domain-containing protein n=1 Tax=Viridothelium virens TaxID=1048519 RepID=A0A6A6HJ24_VIRVR|nr:hypothetical protein EV356DRAFT_508803 [Viridothelium virens]
MQSAPDWYEADQDDICFEPARKAYSDAVTVFASALSRDPRKSQFVKQSDSIDEVLGQIEKAKTNYESDRGKSRTRVWLSKCSKRITYYGNIMDVLVQHHPEYVSLAWGAMKFIFGVSYRELFHVPKLCLLVL